MSVRKRERPGPKCEPRSTWVVGDVETQGRHRLKTFALKQRADAFIAPTLNTCLP